MKKDDLENNGEKKIVPVIQKDKVIADDDHFTKYDPEVYDAPPLEELKKMGPAPSELGELTRFILEKTGTTYKEFMMEFEKWREENPIYKEGEPLKEDD